jgi:hypothetical protein
MRSRLALVILLFAAAANGQQKVTVDDIARRAFDMAGGAAWEQARYFAFTFNLDGADGKRTASFPQRWDRISGDYRVSGLDPQGKKFEVVMNLRTGEGKAWLEGAPVTDDKLPGMLELARRRFQNDTFWLLMPQKLMDPAIRRAYEGGREDACNHVYDILRLTFEPGFGFGPNDVYWAWINRDTGLIEYWDMKLTGVRDEKPVPVTFRDFRRAGGLLISTRRELTSKKQVVRLDDLQVLSEVPKGAFD